jgi:hypothetical protein
MGRLEAVAGANGGVPEVATGMSKTKKTCESGYQGILTDGRGSSKHRGRVFLVRRS